MIEFITAFVLTVGFLFVLFFGWWRMKLVIWSVFLLTMPVWLTALLIHEWFFSHEKLDNRDLNNYLKGRK